MAYTVKDEAEFQRDVVDLARKMGWVPRPRTDGDGVPDLELVKSGVKLYRELKVAADAPMTVKQYRYIQGLLAKGENAGVWTPDDWEIIQQELSWPVEDIVFKARVSLYAMNDRTPEDTGYLSKANRKKAIGQIHASALEGMTEIRYRDPDSSGGYQRVENSNHRKSIVADLRTKGVDFPAVQLALQSMRSDNVVQISDSGFWELRVYEGQKFGVVDGQHRDAALRELMQSGTTQHNDKSWQEYLVDFVCYLDTDEFGEKVLFNDFNGK